MTDIDRIQGHIPCHVDFFAGTNVEHLGIGRIGPAYEIGIVLLVIVPRNGVFALRYGH